LVEYNHIAIARKIKKVNYLMSYFMIQETEQCVPGVAIMHYVHIIVDPCNKKQLNALFTFNLFQ